MVDEINKNVSFIVESPIVAKQRPRATVVGGHARIYPPKETLYYENLVKMNYKEQCGNYSFEDKPISVSIIAYFKRNQELEKYGGLSLGLPKISKPDVDNIAKSITDALNGIAYSDDSQVWSLHVYKLYSATEKIYVEIKEEGKTIFDVKAQYKLEKDTDKYERLKLKEKLSVAEKRFIADYEIRKNITRDSGSN